MIKRRKRRFMKTILAILLLIWFLVSKPVSILKLLIICSSVLSLHLQISINSFLLVQFLVSPFFQIINCSEKFIKKKMIKRRKRRFMKTILAILLLIWFLVSKPVSILKLLIICSSVLSLHLQISINSFLLVQFLVSPFFQIINCSEKFIKKKVIKPRNRGFMKTILAILL